MMNINILNKLIKGISEQIPLVNSYYTQSPYESWNVKEVKYGSVSFVVTKTTTRDTTTTYDAVLYYADRLTEDKANRDSIHSDAATVIQTIVGAINQSDDEYIEISYPVSITLFEQSFNDELAGGYANVIITTTGMGECFNDEYSVPEIVGTSAYYTKEQIHELFPLKNSLSKIAYSGSFRDLLDAPDLVTNKEYNDLVDSFSESLSVLTEEVKQRVTYSYFDSFADNIYTKPEVDELVSNIVVGDELKEYIKDVVNDIADDVIDEALDNIDLDNYYTKSETYTKTEVDTLIDGIECEPVDLDNYYTKSETYTKTEVDTLIDDIECEPVDLSDYYTKQQIDNKGFITSIPSEYVTESELESKGYLTSVPEQYITESELENRLDELNLNVDLSDYYTKQQIDNKGYVTNDDLVTKDYATKDYVAGEINKIDLSDYYNKGEADNRFQPKGNYLTSIPSEYVTETELNAKGYLTSVPSQYITENELNAKGYLTSIPSEYVTESELESKGYATTTQVGNKQDKLVSGSNIKTINGVSILGSGNIDIQSETGDVDLSDYFTKLETYNVFYTKEQIDTMVGAVNQILDSLINDVDTEAIEIRLNNILNEQ